MKKIIHFLALATAVAMLVYDTAAHAATEVAHGSCKVFRGSNQSAVATRTNYADCVAFVASRQVAVGATVKFRIEESLTAKGVSDPPPPPVDCVISEFSCVEGTWGACVDGSRSRVDQCTATIVTPPANGGAACPPLTESRTVTEPCSSTPPPTGMLATLMKFAETWDRNWNFEGHVVTDAFTENQGRWDYTNTTYEPWLFDRATVGYRLFEMTGNARWRDKFLSDFAYYRARIDANGIFINKGGDDTKYGYVTPFMLYEKETGDAQYRPIAKRIYDSWVREWSPNFYPTGQAQLWTEREIGLALESAVSYYEMTGDVTALTRSRALVAQWTTVAGTAGAPLVTYTQHEGGGPGGTTPQTLTHSPWMSALYFQASRRLAAIDPASAQEIQQQASKWFDWCNTADNEPDVGQANCFYEARLTHTQYTGLTFPRYLTGPLIGDAGYDYGNMGHCLDVGGAVRFARDSKAALGLPVAAANLRLAQMDACAARDFQEWTRTTTYLPKYRVNPPRKMNWMVRGYYEATQ